MINMTFEQKKKTESPKPEQDDFKDDIEFIKLQGLAASRETTYEWVV
jgi:hypothetical protein